jgi:hypothetical protein
MIIEAEHIVYTRSCFVRGGLILYYYILVFINKGESSL